MGKGEFAFYLEGKEKKGKVKACLFEKKKKWVDVKYEYI
jgi:hypothetical protein